MLNANIDIWISMAAKDLKTHIGIRHRELIRHSHGAGPRTVPTRSPHNTVPRREPASAKRAAECAPHSLKFNDSLTSRGSPGCTVTPVGTIADVRVAR